MKHKPSFKVSGKMTFPEKAYALIREVAAILAGRVRNYERCRNCFKLGYRRDGTLGVKWGCDGCAEMTNAIIKLRDLFRSEEGVEP